jgi:hypothetical protein
LEPFSRRLVLAPWHPRSGFGGSSAAMYSVFYIIGVIVVILAVLSLLGIR